MYGYGYGPTYVGAPPQIGTLPSEAEFLVHTNKMAAEGAKAGPVGRGTGNLWYLLLATRIAEGTAWLADGPHTNETEITRDLARVREAFRVMTIGRADGLPLFAFVVLYTIDGHKIVDSQWWADARYVVTMDYAPVSAADRAARAALGRT